MRILDSLARRDFLKQAGLAVAACTASNSCTHPQELRASKIAPGKVPDFVPGKLPMKWADDAMIREAGDLHPFDLQRRMMLAANAQTTCVDPDRGYLSYSPVEFQTRPAHMHHAIGDFADDMGRHTDSLHLTQSATRDNYNAEVVQKIAENAMDVVDQGIAWNPPQDPFTWWGTTDKDRPKGRWAHLPEVTRIILGLVTYHRATQDRRALDTAKSMVGAFYRVAEKNDKYLWYPDYNYEQVGSEILPLRVAHGAKVNVKDPRSGTGDLGGDQPLAIMGLLLLPAMRYYEDTKDPVAAELVTKFARVAIDLMPDFAQNIGQTHSALATASGIFRAGQIMGIPEFRTWAEGVYAHFTSLDYIPNFGWTPENTSRPRVKGRLCCEACTTTDYIELSLQLAQYQDEKYWDNVERIAMNQLLEGQMLRTDFFERIPQQDRKPLPKDPAWFFTTDHVLERSLGCFGILAGPNDWVQIGEGARSLQCCFGSGPRGLYDAWYYAAQEEGDAIKVNLLFSKRLPSALITSYMPGKAMLEIQLTQAKKVLVRKPGWANAMQPKILLNGKGHKARLAGTYFDLGPLQAGSTVSIEFLGQTTRSTERIGNMEFRTVWRGNAVVEMEPAGDIYPLYQGRDRKDGAKPLAFMNPDPIRPL